MDAPAQEDRAGDSEAAELAAKLGIYPVARYPVQHATAAFHLATVHLQRGRVDEAVPLLSDAFETFGRLGMRLEQTKALTMHGVALREGGRNDLAAATFERAAQAFSELEQPAEEAAASYNLGLSLAQHGDPAAVRDALTRAHELFLEEGHLAQAGAAARELGAHLLTSGEVGAALTVLDDAAALGPNGPATYPDSVPRPTPWDWPTWRTTTLRLRCGSSRGRWVPTPAVCGPATTPW